MKVTVSARDVKPGHTAWFRQENSENAEPVCPDTALLDDKVYDLDVVDGADVRIFSEESPETAKQEQYLRTGKAD